VLKLIEFLSNSQEFLSSWCKFDDFTVLRTKITDTEVLISTLHELGFIVKIDAEVMAGSNRSQTGILFDTNAEIVITALEELGLSVRKDIEVGADSNHRRVNVVAVVQGNCYLGWIKNTKNTDGAFDLIIDLWAVSKHHKVLPLINKILAKYHDLKIIKDYLS
jgi:Protein of unknown function (DUF1257)